MIRTASQGRNIPSIIVLALDVVGLLALGVAVVWLYQYQYASLSQRLMLLLLFLVPVCLYVLDAYGIQRTGRDRAMVLRTITAIAIAAGIIAVIMFVRSPLQLRPPFVVDNQTLESILRLLAGLGLFAFWAIGIRWWFGRRVRRMEGNRRWLILGFGDSTRRFFEQFDAANTAGQVHLYIPPAADGSAVLSEDELRELPAEISDLHLDDLLEQHWTSIIVSDELPPSKLLRDSLVHQRLSGTRVLNFISFFERYWLKLPVWSLRDQWFFESEGFALVHNRVAARFKRLTDIVGAIVLLLLFAPLVPLIAIAIRTDSMGPILYRQIRSGQGGKPFEIRKFRSMGHDAEKDGAQWAQIDDPRITRAGRFLRKSRLDEVPQLWNVLIGDMSLIGPRPERPRFIKRLRKEIPFYEIRGVVKPGLTGWAQVMAPYGASVEESADKLSYDLYYIKNYSLLLDIVILLKTVRVVLGGRGR